MVPAMSLNGYVRPDGRVGFRNNVVILPLVGCVGDIARRIADRLDGAVALVHPHGCELDGPDADYLSLQMERLLVHPNVGGVILVTMACGATNRFGLAQKAGQAGKLVETVNFHRTGGTIKCVEAGAEIGAKMLAKLGEQPRQALDMSALILGTKCGSSDATSFDVLHKVTGSVCDRLVDEQATVVLGEDYELVPDIENLAKRGVNPRVRSDILRIGSDLEASLRKRHNTEPSWTEEVRAGSAKHAAKAGTKPIQEVIPLEGMIEGPGLVVHNGPNSDLISVTTLAAAGCNMLLFTTGRGTPVGGPLPTVKVTANRKTEQWMTENIDVGVADVTEGKISAQEGAQRIYDALVRHANGEPTKAERLRHTEIQFHIKGVTF